LTFNLPVISIFCYFKPHQRDVNTTDRLFEHEISSLPKISNIRVLGQAEFEIKIRLFPPKMTEYREKTPLSRAIWAE
jgi:hypothetical protein